MWGNLMAWQRGPFKRVKRGLKKVKDGAMSTRLAKALFTYHVTLQSTTRQALAELFCWGGDYILALIC